MGLVDFEDRIKTEEEEVHLGCLSNLDDIGLKTEDTNSDVPVISAAVKRPLSKVEEGGVSGAHQPTPSSTEQEHVKKEEDAERRWIKSEEGEGRENGVIPEPGSPQHVASSLGVMNEYNSVNGSEAAVVRREETENAIAAFMEERENPLLNKVKKKELLALPLDTVYHIITQTKLADLTLPDIAPSVRDTCISRYLISDLLGGSPQDTFPIPRPEKVSEHGIKSYMCLVYSFNPCAPQLPGKSGLFFGLTQRTWRSTDQASEEIEYPYFIRLDSNKWQYLGHYVLKGGRPLTVEEWRQQSPLCRKTWIRDALTGKGFMQHRAYISLRRGLDDKDEVKPEAVGELEAKMAKNRSLDDLSPDEIERAFDRGYMSFFSLHEDSTETEETCVSDQSINARGMQCVRYDVEFQKNLHERSLSWSASRKKVASATGSKRKSRNKVECSSDSDFEDVQVTSVSLRRPTAAKKRTGRSRRSTSSSEGGLDDAIDIDDLENIREQSYVTRGTRSRPAKRVKTVVL